ncbi:MAG: hypothetical protein HYU54_08790 [Actinobacteria bacterium]|nr:hypothetical protein [Actinomycetota bacterium]
MEDFSALASRIAVSVGELRGCVVLSRDGLVLGSYPPGEESLVKPAWLRFAALGDPEKGFVEFGDELWVYVRRGPYAVFAVSAATIRPGLMMDQLEQLLLAAEESRTKREALKVPEVADAPKGKPRTSLHKDVRPAPPTQPAAVRAEPQPTAAAEAPPPAPPIAPERPPAPVAEPAPAPAAPPSPEPVPEPEEGTEVDRVLLAQEFSRLLQESRFGDEDEAT